MLDQFFTIWRRDASTGVASGPPSRCRPCCAAVQPPASMHSVANAVARGLSFDVFATSDGSGQGQPTSSRAGLLGRTSLSSGAPTRAADPDGELDAGGTCIRLHQHPVPAFPWDSSLDQDSSPFLSCTDFGNWKPQAEFHSGWIAHEIFLVRKACRFDLGFADILRRGRNL